MSEPQVLSDFARRCWELVQAMNDKTQSVVDREDARVALAEWIRAHCERPSVADYKVAQAGRDE